MGANYCSQKVLMGIVVDISAWAAVVQYGQLRVIGRKVVVCS